MSAAAKKRFTAPSECPVCGADVPPHARACPECGADERSGWNEESTRYDGMDLPEEVFENDQPDTRGRKKSRLNLNGVPLFWWIVALGALLLLVASALGLQR